MKKNNSFFHALRNYLTVYLPKQKCCSEDTCKSYKEALSIFVNFLENEKGIKLSDITFDILNETLVLEFLDWLQTSRNNSASTRNHRLMVLCSFVRYSGMIDLARIDIHMKLKNIPLQNEQGKIVEFLSENSLNSLLKYPKITKKTEYRNMVFMTLMYDSAARCSELLNLKVKDLRLNSSAPTVYLTGKGNKMRLLPLMSKTAEICEKYLDKFHPIDARNENDYFFFTGAKNVKRIMSPDNVSTFMKKYGEELRAFCPDIPLRVHPHQLRHTRAIHLYRDGMPLALLAEFLGHANVETTKIYAYADTEMKRVAIQKGEISRNVIPSDSPVWCDDDDMLRKLCGLK